jgi:serine protease Do
MEEDNIQGGNNNIDTDKDINVEIIENNGSAESIGDNQNTEQIMEAEAVTNEQPSSDSANESNNSKTPVYYTENFKKPKTRKNSIFQLVLVAFLSSILGGGVVFVAFQFLAPAIQPALGGYFGNASQSSTASATTGSNNGVYKKVEITQSSSPITSIAEKVGPSIIGIKVTVDAQGSGFFFDMSQGGVGEGSGIIIREDGYILTNNHVIEGAVT